MHDFNIFAQFIIQFLLKTGILKHKAIAITVIIVIFLLLGLTGENLSGYNTPGHHVAPVSSSSSSLNGVSISHQLRNSDSEFSGSEAFDHTFSNFLKQHGIKGASVAIALHGRLLYARGYGYADEENKVEMEPYHILRIASVSKLLTATAIMKLIDQGKLTLDSKVFGKNGLLNDSAYLSYRDKRYEKITIRHLLSHTAGWSKRNGDPVFTPHSVARKMKTSLPVDIPATIKYALSMSLTYSPGTHYSYSNLGYVILGQIISKLSGKPYEDYIQQEILEPLGIFDMHIGNSLVSDRFWNESRYYQLRYTTHSEAYDGSGETVPALYGGYDMHLLGAAGGWLASPSELMKFILSIDGDSSVTQILSKKTIEDMTTPDKEVHRTLGWGGTDDDGNLWRTGSLIGTNALVIKRKSGLTWIVILNSSGPHQKSIPYYILKTMEQGIDSVRNWPDIDLFTYKKMDSATPLETGLVN